MRGVLDPVAAGRAFTLELRPPAADVADLVATDWLVRWDLARLALDLGYADQAHLSADLRARTRRTPGADAGR